MEGREKVMSYFTPILFLFSLGWFMYMYSFSPEDIQNNLLLFVELAFLTITLNFLIKASWQFQNASHKRNLYILEESKNMAEQEEADLENITNKLIPIIKMGTAREIIQAITDGSSEN